VQPVFTEMLSIAWPKKRLENRVAEQGHAEAQFKLWVMYADGQGVTRDSTEAVKWLRKAADHGR